LEELNAFFVGVRNHIIGKKKFTHKYVGKDASRRQVSKCVTFTVDSEKKPTKDVESRKRRETITVENAYDSG
jgi:hypothetical protein